MMKKLKLSISVILLLFSSHILAQNDTIPKKLNIAELEALAGAAYQSKDYSTAKGHIESIILELENQGKKDSLVYVNWQQNLTSILERLGENERALMILDEVKVAILKNWGMESEMYLGYCNNMRGVYTSMGEYRKSHEYAVEAFEIAEKRFEDTHDWYTVTLSNLISSQMHMGDFEKALKLSTRLIAITEKTVGKEHRKYGLRMIKLGGIYVNTKQIEKALPIIMEGLEVLENIFGKGHPACAEGYHKAGDIFDNLAEYQTALHYRKLNLQAIAKSRGKKHKAYGICLGKMGIAYSRLNQLDSAEHYYQAASDFYQSNFKEGDMYYHLSKRELGYFYRKTGQYEKARVIFEETLKWYLNNPEQSQRELNTAYLFVSDINHRLGNLDRAYEVHQQTLLEMEKAIGKSNTRYANAQLQMAEILEEMGRKEESVQAFLTACQIVSKYIGNVFPHFSEREQRNFKRSFSDDFNEIFSFAYRNSFNEVSGTCYDNNLHFKGLLLKNQKAFAKINFDDHPNLAADYQEWESLGHTIAQEYSLSLSKRKSSLDSTEERYNQLGRELSKASIAFRNQQAGSWKEVQSQLKPGELAIEIIDFNYVAEQKTSTDSVFYMAYLLKKEDQFPQQVFLFEKSELGRLKATRRLYANESTLNQVLWKQLEPHLEGIHTIYYAPSGLLHRINFGAIPINNSQTVADRFEVYHLGSTRQLIYPHKTPKYTLIDAYLFGGIHYETTSTELIENAPQSDLDSESITLSQTDELLNAQVLGGSFRSLRGDDWGYLEWTERETNDIQKILEKSDVKVTVQKGYDASEEAFKQIGQKEPSPRILHLATHGYFFPDADTTAASGFRASKHPLIRSGLILAGANAAWKGNAPESGEDGILTAYEIAKMDLRNTELVVLSACETGLGDIEGNEGVYGLQRAFKIAGAKYLLMSLWKVNDAEAYEFMTTFYKAWQEQGKSIPEAYQVAQAHMRLQQPNNPRSWAGFVLVE